MTANAHALNRYFDPFGIAEPLRFIAGAKRTVAFGIATVLPGSKPLQLHDYDLNAVWSVKYVTGRALWLVLGATMPIVSAGWFKTRTVDRIGASSTNIRTNIWAIARVKSPTVVFAISLLCPWLRITIIEFWLSSKGGVWRATLASVIGAGMFLPLQLAFIISIPIAWAFVSFRLGDLGVRATGGACRPIYDALAVDTAQHMLSGLTSGAMLMSLASIGVLARLAIVDWRTAIILITGSIALSGLSLLLGRVTRSPTPFLIVSLLLCYSLATAGPIP